ncbi:hypothetical protein KKF61_01550, partial [Patescibacteria group bacterium]|nr:hypothetical protein [Patescibacteria group bacterium]
EDLFNDSQYLEFVRNKYTGFTNQQVVTVQGPGDVLAPKNLIVSAPEYGQILHLSWDASPEDNIVGYRLFRSEYPFTQFNEIAIIEGNVTEYNDYLVENDLQYIYAVKAIRAVEDSRVENQGVSYDKVSGNQVGIWLNDDLAIEFEFSFQDIAMMWVIRKQGGISKVIATLPGNKAKFVDNYGASDDTYTVISYSVYGESELSEAVVGTPRDRIEPDAPINFKVENREEGGVLITWVNPIDKDFKKVNIYRSVERGELGVLLYSDIGLGEEGSDSRYFIDNDVDSNVNYYYTITSIDQDGNETTKNLLTAPYNYNPFKPVIF